MTTALALGAGLILSLLSGSGASGQTFVNWDQYLYGLGHSSYNGAATAITTANAKSLIQQWTWTPPTYPDRGDPLGTNHLEVSPVVHDGAIYLGTTSGHFYAIDEATGAPLPNDGSSSFWGTDGIDLGYSLPCPDRVPGPATGIGDTAAVAYDATVGDDVIYVQSGPGPAPSFSPPIDPQDVGGSTGGVYLNAIKTDGEKLWRVNVTHQVGSYSWSSPVVTGGHVYVGVSSYGDCPLVQGGIAEFDQHTGALLHTYWSTPAGTVGASIWTTPATDGKYLWATTGNGCCGDSFSIVRLDMNVTKIEKWRAPASSDQDFGSSPTLFGASINGAWTPMVGGCEKNQYFYAFRRLNLAAGPVWSKLVAIPGGSYLRCISGAVWDTANHRLYVGTPDTTIKGQVYPGSVKRLDPATGAIVWQTSVSGPVFGTPTLDGGGVLAAATFGPTLSTNVFVLFNAATGAKLKTYRMTGTAEFGQPVFADDFLFQPTWNGDLTAYTP